MTRRAPSSSSRLLIGVIVLAVIVISTGGLWYWFGAVDDMRGSGQVTIYGQEAENYLIQTRAIDNLPPPSQEQIDRARTHGITLVDP